MTNKILIILALVVGTVVYYLQAVVRWSGSVSNEVLPISQPSYIKHPGEVEMISVSFLAGLGTFLFLKAFLYFLERMQKYFHHIKKNKK